MRLLVKIATCGTRLDYHGKNDDLLIGEVCNMDGIVEIMMTAENVIQPC